MEYSRFEKRFNVKLDKVKFDASVRTETVILTSVKDKSGMYIQFDEIDGWQCIDGATNSVFHWATDLSRIEGDVVNA